MDYCSRKVNRNQSLVTLICDADSGGDTNDCKSTKKKLLVPDWWYSYHMAE